MEGGRGALWVEASAGFRGCPGNGAFLYDLVSHRGSQWLCQPPAWQGLASGLWNVLEADPKPSGLTQ